MLRTNGLDINTIRLDAILKETIEIEQHIHNHGRWFGKLGVQNATDWAEQAGLVPFRAISGLGVFGADANDEALVLGTDDTPAIAGMTRFDAHRILISAASNATNFILRLIHGSGTMAAAELAGSYSDVMVQEARKGAPIDITQRRAYCGTDKVWLRAKNATNNATVDFFIGIHEYET